VGEAGEGAGEDLSAAEEDDGGFLAEVKNVLRKTSMRVDLTPEDVDNRVIFLEFSKVGSLEVVSDEDITSFLAPFHIGPDR
jgi:hypothetical protein